MNPFNIRFSVIMPTFNQCGFIRRAILSLMQQTYPAWELIIVNDGCTDATEDFIGDYLTDERVTYIKNPDNTGLGHALNQGLDAAHYDYIAYLPSDDYYFPRHLENLAKAFSDNGDAILIYTGIRYETRDSLYRNPDTQTDGQRRGCPLQLVQTTHRKTDDRWTERCEWISEDLFAMYWQKLAGRGMFVPTGKITACWTSHPHQRHKLVSERYGGGINKLRNHYKTKTPLRIRLSKEKTWDEAKVYSSYRSECALAEKPMKILIVGELAYNPERIYALEQAGHKLYGLWYPQPGSIISTIGPLPFGHVEDIPFETWRERIREVSPDIIYGMLNAEIIGWVYDVVRAVPDIPFAWHLKEGPHMAVRMGLWEKLVWLYDHAAVRIFLNEVVRDWFMQFLPEKDTPTIILDGDLPKQDYFKDCFSEKLSASDGDVHTVIAGRMIGIGTQGLRVLAENNVHVHLYTENFHIARAKLLNHYKEKFPSHFHLHPHVSPADWTREFSKYNAGWMHNVTSSNGGNLLVATWDDLNLPARMSTYMAAGLPVIHSDNSGNIVAMEKIIDERGIGISYKGMADLVEKLRDRGAMKKIAENVMRHRLEFSFDYHVPEIITTFKKVIN